MNDKDIEMARNILKQFKGGELGQNETKSISIAIKVMEEYEKSSKIEFIHAKDVKIASLEAENKRLERTLKINSDVCNAVTLEGARLQEALEKIKVLCDRSGREFIFDIAKDALSQKGSI